MEATRTKTIFNDNERILKYFSFIVNGTLATKLLAVGNGNGC